MARYYGLACQALENHPEVLEELEVDSVKDFLRSELDKAANPRQPRVDVARVTSAEQGELIGEIVTASTRNLVAPV